MGIVGWCCYFLMWTCSAKCSLSTARLSCVGATKSSQHIVLICVRFGLRASFLLWVRGTLCNYLVDSFYYSTMDDISRSLELTSLHKDGLLTPLCIADLAD